MTEREKFEAEYRKRSDRDDDDVEESLRLGKDGKYLYGGTWTAFYWWQAARAKSPQVPEGMALVPVEPTDEMVDAAEKVDWSSSDTRASIINMWQVMLAATKDQQCQS